MVERRIDRRIPIRIKVLIIQEGRERECYTVNVSRGGLFIETDEPLMIDSIISMKVFFDDNREIDVVGKIVWVSYPHKDSNYIPGMGIKFLDLSPEKVEEIGAFIGEHIKKDIEVSEDIDYSMEERIVITSEDIYEQNTELIVSFAGIGIKDLVNHTKFILDKGGYLLRVEYEKRADTLGFGESFLMPIDGALKAKYVLHTAIPSFYDSYGEELLRMSTIDVLKKASKQGFRTLFYPAFSLLEVGFPIGVSAKILIGSTYGFLREEKFPIKVFFFCNNQDLMVFEKVKREILGN